MDSFHRTLNRPPYVYIEPYPRRGRKLLYHEVNWGASSKAIIVMSGSSMSGRTLHASTSAVASVPEQMASSMTGAVLTSLVVTPFDVIKTRIQAQQSWTSAMKKALDCTSCGGRRTYVTLANNHMKYVCKIQNGGTSITSVCMNRIHIEGTVDGAVKIFRYEGAGALWRGLTATLLMSIPSNVIYITGYDQIKEGVIKHNLVTKEYAPLLAGVASRLAAVCVTSPLEMVRTQIQSQPEKIAYSKLMKVLANGVRVHGITSLWRGLVPTLWRDVPFSGLYWSTYETIKPMVLELLANCTDDRTFAPSFVSGATAGMMAAIVTHPFDVMKTHRQMHQMVDTSLTLRSICGTIVRGHGFGGFFAGLIPRVVKVAPSCAIMISTYEVGKAFFQSRRQNADFCR